MRSPDRSFLRAIYLYVIGPVEGPHKIGITSSLKTRLSQLKARRGVGLAVKMSIRVDPERAGFAEDFAHSLVRKFSLGEEWFAVSEAEACEAVRRGAAEAPLPADPSEPSGLTDRPPRGRPALKGLPAMVRLRVDQFDRIDALVGPGDRAAFIRDAVMAELIRREDERCATKPLERR